MGNIMFQHYISYSYPAGQLQEMQRTCVKKSVKVYKISPIIIQQSVFFFSTQQSSRLVTRQRLRVIEVVVCMVHVINFNKVVVHIQLRSRSFKLYVALFILFTLFFTRLVSLYMLMFLFFVFYFYFVYSGLVPGTWENKHIPIIYCCTR